MKVLLILIMLSCSVQKPDKTEYSLTLQEYEILDPEVIQDNDTLYPEQDGKYFLDHEGKFKNRLEVKFESFGKSRMIIRIDGVLSYDQRRFKHHYIYGD